MEAYVVGGWVRDRMLEREGRGAAGGGDRDWVVVGSTPEEMVALGYRPVGRDFPVFLHPQTHEEYALARTERKVGPGYHGFTVHAAPDVTLDQDLQRRDLTINAMALDGQGRLIDPHGGLADLRARVLRHVGPAFAEDPVRILRLARFAARFADFSVDPGTLALARSMVDAGEADALVAERVWQELARGLMERRPARMIEVLEQTGLLAKVLPGMRPAAGLLAALDRAAAAGAALPVRFAVLCAAAPSPEELRGWLGQLRADGDCMQLAQLLFELREALRSASRPEERLRLLDRADAWRRPERFERLLQAHECLDGPSAIARWRAAAAAGRGIDAGAVAAAAGPDAASIARAVARARLEAIAAV